MTPSLGGKGGENISSMTITNMRRTLEGSKSFLPPGHRVHSLVHVQVREGLYEGEVWWDGLKLINTDTTRIVRIINLEHCLWGQETMCEHNKCLQVHTHAHTLLLEITHSTHIHHSSYIFLYGDGIHLRVPFGKLSKLGKVVISMCWRWLKGEQTQ